MVGISSQTGGINSPYQEIEAIITPNGRYLCPYVTNTLNIIETSDPKNLYVIFGRSSNETHYTPGMQYIMSEAVECVTIINKSKTETMTVNFAVGGGGMIVDNRLNLNNTGIFVANTTETALSIKEKKYTRLSSQRLKINNLITMDSTLFQLIIKPDGANKTRLQNVSSNPITLYDKDNGSILVPYGVEEITLNHDFTIFGAYGSELVFERFE